MDVPQSRITPNEIHSQHDHSQPPPPPPNITIPSIPIITEKKNVDDIQALLNYGVDLKVIANVKNMSIDDLLNFIHVKQLKLPIPNVNKPGGYSDGSIIAGSQFNSSLQPLMSPHGTSLMNGAMHGLPMHLMLKKEEKVRTKKQRKKSWKEQEFPVTNEGKYFCLDCVKGSYVRDCRECGRASWRWCEDCKKYQQPSYHVHFIEGRKKIKKKWKEEDFPIQKEDDEKVRYFCGDCRKLSKVLECPNCHRKCWRWCDDCMKYRQATNHSHFINLRKKKRKRWKMEEFPKTNVSKYYCLDCPKSNETRKCVCGRDGWRWCDECSKYYSKSHIHFRKKKTLEEELVDTSGGATTTTNSSTLVPPSTQNESISTESTPTNSNPEIIIPQLNIPPLVTDNVIEKETYIPPTKKRKLNP